MIANFQHKLLQQRVFPGKNWVLDALSIIIALIIYNWILANASSSILDALIFKTRTGFTEFIPFFILSLYIAFRLPGPLGRFFSVTLTFMFFGLALAELWRTGQSQSTVFNGIIPLFDASSYYNDALRLTVGQSFSSFSARRPLFPGLLAVLLVITNQNLMASLGILTAITAAACYLAAVEIKRTHGAEAAVFVLLILFLFYRFHSGLVMSEGIGVALGALGFALIWQGLYKLRPSIVWTGIFVFTLAVIARAGTFFVLPFLVLYGAWIFRKPASRLSWQFLVGGVGAICAGFLLNWLVFHFLATDSGTIFANFSYSLFGLSSGGKSWAYIFTVHPELSKVPEPYQSREIYRLAFEQIFHNPSLLLRGMLYNWSRFFSFSDYSAYTYVAGKNAIVNLIAQWGLYILCVLGVYKWIRNKPSDIFSGLVVTAALGVVISAPFLPPTDSMRMRPYASSMIIFALLPAMGLVFILEKLNRRTAFFSKPDPNIPNYQAGVWLSLILVSVMTIGPYIVKLSGNSPRLPAPACETGETSIVARLDTNTYFNVIPDASSTPDGLPNFHLSTYKHNSHNLADPNLINWATKITPSASIIYVFDYRTYGSAIIISRNGLPSNSRSLTEVCGYWETAPNLVTNYNILYARSMNVISP